MNPITTSITPTSKITARPGEWPPLRRRHLGVQIVYSARQTHDDPGENDERHSVAYAALADLLAQPHDECRTGRQRQDGHQRKSDARVVHQRRSVRPRLALQREGDRERLHDAQDDRQVAGVLRDLPPAQLPFFLQPLEIGPRHGHQLQDDRSRDVRHDAQRENRQAPEIAAAEKIDNPQHRPLILLEQLRQNVRVDSGCRQKRAHAVHRENRQGKQNPLAQIGNPEHVGEGFKKLVHGSRSTFPPARVIFSSAD